jgi:hypothetical protein
MVWPAAPAQRPELQPLTDHSWGFLKAVTASEPSARGIRRLAVRRWRGWAELVARRLLMLAGIQTS